MFAHCLLAYRVSPASFEPSIDYVVTKIPRFAFEKFPQAVAPGARHLCRFNFPQSNTPKTVESRSSFAP